VDQHLGPARLEWWANVSTCLASYDVTVAPATVTGDRAAIGTGEVHLDAGADLEAFAWLCDLDPVFLLCFPDEREVLVVLEPGTDRRHVSISRYDGPHEREVTVTFPPDP
jgi:hypothetical protein